MKQINSFDRPGYQSYWAVTIDTNSKVKGHWAYREIKKPREYAPEIISKTDAFFS